MSQTKLMCVDQTRSYRTLLLFLPSLKSELIIDGLHVLSVEVLIPSSRYTVFLTMSTAAPMASVAAPTGGSSNNVLSDKVNRALHVRTDTPAMRAALDALVSSK